MTVIYYLISFPERLVRFLGAAAGGFVFEVAELILPTWFRRSRLYQALVYRFLRLAIELVGGVSGIFPADEMAASELAVRKTAGNVVELAGLLTVGWSPLWLLAATADLTGGARLYLRAFVTELQQNQILPADIDIASVEDLLNALENSSGRMADMVDVPPLNVQQLRASWHILQKDVHGLPDANRLTGIYAQLQQVAQQENRPLWAVSSLVAVGAVKAGYQIGSSYVFEYYKQALRSMGKEGLVRYARRVFRPYLSAAFAHFNPQHETYTGRFLLRLRRKR